MPTRLQRHHDQQRLLQRRQALANQFTPRRMPVDIEMLARDALDAAFKDTIREMFGDYLSWLVNGDPEADLRFKEQLRLAKAAHENTKTLMAGVYHR